MEQLAWHYTRGYHFVEIIDSGVLKLATAGISAGERHVLWFTINQRWEPTEPLAKRFLIYGNAPSMGHHWSFLPGSALKWQI